MFPFDGEINGESLWDDDSYFGFGQEDNVYGPPHRKQEDVEIICDIKHETEKAYLIKTDANDPFWIPKSQCKKTKEGMKIPRWLYNKK